MYFRCKVRRLLENGVGAKLSDYDKRTPLHVASAEGHDKVTPPFSWSHSFVWPTTWVRIGRRARNLLSLFLSLSLSHGLPRSLLSLTS